MVSEEAHPPRKRKRLAACGVQARHANDMSLVTSSNAHQCPQWRVTHWAGIPVRMRTARPLGPSLDILKIQFQFQNFLSKVKEGHPAAAGPSTRAQADD